ncbi:MAG: hypothetical protein N2D54_07300 [Chloroflexota bacterium]
MDLDASQYYYAKNSWDIEAWVDVIAIEYESLIQNYPFDKVFSGLSSGKPLNLLDVGCGTGIFPSYLDKVLSDEIMLSCDLLDIAAASIQEARQTFSALKHFEAKDGYQILIEELPQNSIRQRTMMSSGVSIHSLL